MIFSFKKWKFIVFLNLFLLVFSGRLFAQYDYLFEFEDLYPDCMDDEESTIYGGTYPNKWPKNLNLPVFPGGGDTQLSRFVHSNIEYPDIIDSITPGATPGAPDIEHRPKGVVYVEVVIDRCGRATRQRIVRPVLEEYDTEALRIMENLPVFKPGAIDGMRVKVALVIPVYFTRNTKKKQPRDYYYDDYYDDYDSYDDSGKRNDNYNSVNYDDIQYDDIQYDDIQYDDYDSY